MASSKGVRAEARASRFIVRRETGPWGEDEQREFERWLSESTLHRVAYYRLNAAWHEAGRLKVLHAGERPAVPPSPAKCEPSRRWFARRIPLAVAAGVVIAIAGTLGLFRETLFSTESYRTGIGGLETVQMVDGSRVTLNTNSRVRIRVDRRERRVELTQGEVFFDVAKDSTRLFAVYVGERRVVAMGTRFAVRRDADEVQVRVTEGAVRMEARGGENVKDSAEAILLPAGTMARSEAGGVLVEERSIPEIEQKLTWRSGVLTFNRTPLAEAVEEINRYNTRQIVIQDPGAGSILIGGTFAATKVDSFLRLLQSGFPVRIVQESDRIVIDSW